jgi:hypothetical protein
MRYVAQFALKLKKPTLIEEQLAHLRYVGGRDYRHQPPYLFCEVTGCDYATEDYKEFFRHLLKVHKFKYLKLPKALANALEKTGKPG